MIRKTIKKRSNPKPKTPYYKKPWVIASFSAIFSIFGTMLVTGSDVFRNLENLPASYTSALHSFKSWYFQDSKWTGFYTIHPEGFVDLEDMNLNLSEVDLEVDIQAEQGNLGGTIVSHAICKSIPLYDFILLEGKVDLVHTSSAYLVAYDFIGGKRVNFATLKINSEGIVLRLETIEDPMRFFQKVSRVAKVPDQQKTNEGAGYCKKEHDAFFEKLHEGKVFRKKP